MPHRFGGGAPFVVPGTYDQHMSEGPGPDHSYRDPRAKTGSQRVLNESWPLRDDAGVHARGIDDRPAEEQLDVDVRVEFQDDGETILQGRAIRWTENHTHTCVWVNDARLVTPYLWVRSHDVRPRTT